MSKTQVQWSGDLLTGSGFDDYAALVQKAVVDVANYFAPVLEAYAKDNAEWTDQTGNARQSLNAGVIEELSRDMVIIYLQHGVNYGGFLETRWSGRYAIIWPTIEQHLEQVREMLQGIFG